MDKNLVEEAVSELSTLQDMIRWTISQLNKADVFYGHGTDNAWDEAVQLVLPSLFLPLELPPHMLTCQLTTAERKKVTELVVRRIQQRTPVPYLTNKAWFCGLEFYVDERVLVPRSPIGELIQAQFQPWLTQEPQRIMDLCTGSGCIAISCAYEFPEAEVDAVDISPEALQVAEMNIEQHGLIDRVFPLQSDGFKSLMQDSYDLIVTNPPYVDQEDMDSLPQEFEHEPELGLAAGFDGLDLVRRILANAPNYLSQNGILVCEVGNSMVHMIEQYPEIPFTWIEFEHGGHGVFMLTREQLVLHAALFAKYVD